MRDVLAWVLLGVVPLVGAGERKHWPESGDTKVAFALGWIDSKTDFTGKETTFVLNGVAMGRGEEGLARVIEALKKARPGDVLVFLDPHSGGDDSGEKAFYPHAGLGNSKDLVRVLEETKINVLHARGIISTPRVHLDAERRGVKVRSEVPGARKAEERD